MSRAKVPLRFADWVPEPARRRIDELRETPWGMDDIGRDLLERLATREAMKDDVWGKLPPEPKFIQEKIIDWVILRSFNLSKARSPLSQNDAQAARMGEAGSKVSTSAKSRSGERVRSLAAGGNLRAQDRDGYSLASPLGG
jgi:hypothetical protein